MIFRLYSFVANLYLSPLQHGLQTAHVVSELSQLPLGDEPRAIFDDWARRDKTIVILGAGNSLGVREAYSTLSNLVAQLNMELPIAIFHEDEQSLNGAATACGVILPDHIFNARWIPSLKVPSLEDGLGGYALEDANGGLVVYEPGSPEHNLIAFVKGYRLA